MLIKKFKQNGKKIKKYDSKIYFSLLYPKNWLIILKLHLRHLIFFLTHITAKNVQKLREKRHQFASKVPQAHSFYVDIIRHHY